MFKTKQKQDTNSASKRYTYLRIIRNFDYVHGYSMRTCYTMGKFQFVQVEEFLYRTLQWLDVFGQLPRR